MIKNGVYAASLSILNSDKSLDTKSTINHAESAIKSGLHGVFFFGSTGQSQLVSISEKKRPNFLNCYKQIRRSVLFWDRR